MVPVDARAGNKTEAPLRGSRWVPTLWGAEPDKQSVKRTPWALGTRVFTNSEMNGLEESTGMTFSAGETKHGSFATEKIQILFGDDSIKSVVISVFKNKNKIGLLLIGSKDKTRYLGDEDTTFIEFIRDIAEAKLKTFPA